MNLENTISFSCFEYEKTNEIMENIDIVREMGHATLVTRMKRISDRMMHSARMMYREMDLDFEPNWFLILKLLKTTPRLSVMDISRSIGFAHQSIQTITNKMVERGYLTEAKDDQDRRKTMYSLTKKSQTVYPTIERVWQVGEEAIFELLDGDTSILDSLETMEINLTKSSFGERIINKLNKT